ncbi:hypothetical protein AB0H76_36730 [Nocardia sp. NPDC050712]|uniref:hypothetical protein n=1 Tax=Nocardia sp. NPDC050712 TaxID=3155518 RepID=UPI0033D81C6A
MGSSTLGVKTGELGALGNEIMMSAAIVTNSAKRISDNMFGNGSNSHGPEAGRNYVNEGKQIYSGLENVGKWLKAWGDAGNAIGDGIGASSIAYSNTDTEAAKNTAAQTQKI